MISDENQQDHRPSSGLRGPVGLMADLVAGIGVGVHVKLLSGYMFGALLVLGMSVLTLVVISNMNHQVEELTQLQEQVASASRKNIYITSQLHNRALSLLTNDEAFYASITQSTR